MDSSYQIVKLKSSQAEKFGSFVVEKYNLENGTSLRYVSIDGGSVRRERCGTDDRYRFRVYAKQAGAQETIPYQAILVDKQPGSNSHFKLRDLKREV